ncbi:winged helix-turn-helix domain-containing protein [Nocardia sp. NBC_00565]|uniref:AfsR/SARP family transcriptional regulator n=1 Tax=Nocardia sp. NBC_00565 TaxID=2975993 RepID=UPI002E807A81|nr:BTAD domain-containing putative transcriptional regulator [Nocardia sp. NBC_00565]WUC01210.1 winged helix-turn-helix domain-containing protein [Nocardia sp. NBC_00565]
MSARQPLLAYDYHGMFPDQSGPSGRSQTLTTPAGESVVVALLGEVALRRDGALTALPGARSRLLLAALALRPGRSRSAQALIDEVWGEQPPRAPMNALHTQVSRLRSALPDAALEIGPAGYRLTLTADQVDLTLADELVRVARARQAGGDHTGSLSVVAQARSLWRGEPGADLPAGQLADELRTAAAHRLAELEAIEVAARVASGDLDGAVAITRRTATANPLDEAAHATLMRLLAAAGRPNEALDVFASIRGRLIEELGADPGPALVELNTTILRGDPLPGFAPRSDRAAPVSNTAAAPTPPTDSAAPSVLAVRDTVVRDSAGRNSAGPVPESTVAAPQGVLSAIGLRAAPNALLGRADDLDALEQLLRQSRVTTVLGPGGTGKTRVANELGARVARGESVVMVELASVQADTGADADPRSDIEAAISTTLGLGELGEIVRETGWRRSTGYSDAGRRLRDALAARPMLLILDNCEHLIDAVAEVVADLVGGCDQLSVLTTSRAPLAITAETVYPLSPLAIDAAGSPATDLFMARARAVRPTVRLDPDVVARLCGTLDGLPLAIELAAARVRTMSVEEIETRLEHRFALLRSGDRSSPERHRTLHAVIAWSWNLLEEPQQIALRRLCRFPAGFTLDAAEVVAGGPDIDDVATAVDGLVSQSLLTVLDDDEGLIGTRYRMLETVREFGEEQLAKTGSEAAAGIPGAVDERPVVMDRMSRWARDFSIAAVHRYVSDAQVATVLSVGADLDNLTAVLRYALERRDARTVYRVFPVVGTLWVMRGAHMELSSWARRIVGLAPEPGPVRGTVADLQMLAHLQIGMHMVYLGGDLRDVATPRARIRRLLGTAIDLNGGARFLGVMACSDPTGAGMARLFADGARSPDPVVRAAALFMRANVRENSGHVYGSTRDAQAALRLIVGKDVWGRAMATQHLGQLAGQTAHYADAVENYRLAGELLRELRAHEEAVEIRSYLALSLIGAGRLDEARRELGYALGAPDGDPAHGSSIDDPHIRRNHRLAPVVIGVAELELAEGDIDAGFRHYRRALELYGWPDDEPVPGPGVLMTASGALNAYVLHGRPAVAEDIARTLIRLAAGRLAQFYDLPQIGAVGNAIGTFHLALESDSEIGLELLSLATKVMARQDNPSAEVRRHLELHRPTVGDERIDAALRRAAGLRRRQAASRILELLQELASDDESRDG